LYAGEIISKALQFVVIIAIARMLGAEDFGKYSFVVSFAFIFGIIVDLGLSSFVNREVAKNRSLANKFFFNILLLKSILAVISYGLIVWVVNLMDYPYSTDMVFYVLGGSVIISSFAEFFKSFFRAFEKMHFEAIMRIIEKTVLALAVFYVLFYAKNLINISWVFLFTSILTVLLGYYFVSRIFVINVENDVGFLKVSIKDAVWFTIIFIVYTLYSRIGITILSILKGDVVTGNYSAAYQLIEGLMFISLFLAYAVFPTMVVSFAKMKARFLKVFTKAFDLSVLIAAPIAVGTTLLAGRFMHLFFGEQYSGAGDVLILLVWALFLMFMTNLCGTTLLAMREEKKLGIIYVIVLTVNVVSNLVLVPSLDMRGSAVALILSELVYLSICLFLLIKRIGNIFMSLKIFRISLSAAIMGVVVYFLTRYLATPLVVLVAACVYATAAIMLKAISSEDISLFKEAISNNSRGESR
jgi:O-antigen/teichoic acid export membrane protein